MTLFNPRQIERIARILRGVRDAHEFQRVHHRFERSNMRSLESINGDDEAGFYATAEKMEIFREAIGAEISRQDVEGVPPCRPNAKVFSFPTRKDR
ncbi:hypothetical protein [Hoeflea sp.]|uniref:hypothetical protein n=1 Tax=Hoeflea sp. TaxID=1940281 RepID=UPI0025C36488|nr:hypothetical protein [Hoeflea sp.]MBU4529186.1 hypothetical protein [Alphaproteobacteria bacterium]MBU4549216.1 hypothetical protein [Alphaproteobacteria bacterium]MBV1785312.1 hypothetical protein [Hoeflea sp.]